MARKGENIFKRKDGRWEARYPKEKNNKGNIIKYGYVYGKSYIDAKRKKETAIENINKNINMNNKVDYYNESFEVEIIKWFNEKSLIKESTYYNYYSIITGKLIPFFKKNKLSDFNKLIINNFIKELKEEKLNAKRIKDILLLLNQFLKSKDIIIEFDYPSFRKNNISVLSDNEINTIEKDALNTDDIKKFAILLTLFTGIRIGELCALQWKDIDLEKKVIYITKNIIRIKLLNDKNFKTTNKIDVPKTITSIRNIPIKDELIPYIKKFKKNKELFLLSENENFLTPSKYYFFYKKYLKKLDIKNYKFHTLRHTFATRSLSFGMNIKTLSDILGHTSVKITLDLYVHISDEEKRKQINKIPLLSINK